MRKTILILALILVLGIGSIFAYAKGSSENRFTNLNDRRQKFEANLEDWFESFTQVRRDNLNSALKEGQITEEESIKWNEHFDYMEEFHKENGFKGYGYGYGGCSKRSIKKQVSNY